MVSQYLTGKVNKEAVVDYTYCPDIFLVGLKTFTKYAPGELVTAEFEQNTNRRVIARAKLLMKLLSR
jgi:hypothetical protein